VPGGIRPAEDPRLSTAHLDAALELGNSKKSKAASSRRTPEIQRKSAHSRVFPVEFAALVFSSEGWPRAASDFDLLSAEWRGAMPALPVVLGFRLASRAARPTDDVLVDAIGAG
jgi:hypothetical protein